MENMHTDVRVLRVKGRGKVGLRRMWTNKGERWEGVLLLNIPFILSFTTFLPAVPLIYRLHHVFAFHIPSLSDA